MQEVERDLKLAQKHLRMLHRRRQEILSMRKRKRAIELGFKPAPRTRKPMTRHELQIMYNNMGKEWSVPLAEVREELSSDLAFAYMPSTAANIVALAPLSRNNVENMSEKATDTEISGALKPLKKTIDQGPRNIEDDFLDEMAEKEKAAAAAASAAANADAGLQEQQPDLKTVIVKRTKEKYYENVKASRDWTVYRNPHAPALSPKERKQLMPYAREVAGEIVNMREQGADWKPYPKQPYKRDMTPAEWEPIYMGKSAPKTPVATTERVSIQKSDYYNTVEMYDNDADNKAVIERLSNNFVDNKTAYAPGQNRISNNQAIIA